MWGRATLTMVASSTTISWAVRMTAEDDGGMAAPPARPLAGDLRLGPLTSTFPLVF